MTLQMGLMGHPVAHSRSPEIHHAFGRQLGLDVRYELYDTPPDTLEARLQDLAERGVCGMNVTVPLKEPVFRRCSQLSDRARAAGAVNTLIAQGSDWLGDNTDGAGLMYDLEQYRGFSCAGKTVLLLGAGGAVRGALGPLLAAGPARLHIVNRVAATAEQLAHEFAPMASPQGVRLTASDYPGCPELAPDLVVNGTSASLQGVVPPLAERLCRSATLAYDMMYASEPTVFMRWAEQAGASATADGRGMLVGQAAESFRLWTGQQPEIGPVMAGLGTSW